MAAIDKTYLNDFAVYQEFINWAKNTVYTCPNGVKLPVINYVLTYWTEEAMREKSRPVLCSSFTLDYFLIKYCPFEFVQSRLREVYSEQYYNDVLDGVSEYDKFVYPEIATKFTVVRGKNMKHKNYLWRLKGHKYKFFTRAEYNDTVLWYNDELKRFLLPDELGEPSCSHFYGSASVKSLIRKLRKMNIPKNTILECHARYVGENLLILAK